jgi:mannose-6-phosphate isomerase-like protein (cupin superfamily)
MTANHVAGVLPVFHAAGDGDSVWAMGNRFTFKVRSSESGGGLSVMEVQAPVGTAPPLHVHRNEAEVFFLLEGTMVYLAGEERFTLEPGSSIYLPRDVPHTFRVTGASPARFLALTAPGGLDDLYASVGAPAGEGLPAPPTPEEIGAWLGTAPNFGIEVLGPPLSETP